MLKKLALALTVTTSVFAGDLVSLSTDIQTSSNQISRLSARIEFGRAGVNAEENLKRRLTQLIRQAREMKALLPDSGPVNPPRPTRLTYVGKCHIDDDSFLDLNQEVVDVQGVSIGELISDCDAIARATYIRGSITTAVIDIEVIGNIPRGMQSAVCHIDDDSFMDFDQVIGGLLVGSSVSEIISA